VAKASLLRKDTLQLWQLTGNSVEEFVAAMHCGGAFLRGWLAFCLVCDSPQAWHMMQVVRVSVLFTAGMPSKRAALRIFSPGVGIGTSREPQWMTSRTPLGVPVGS